MCEVLCQLDKLRELPVFLFAETFDPSKVDPAVLRRITWSIEIPRPNASCRAEILRRQLRKVPIDAQLDIEEVSTLIAGECEGATGRDLLNLLRSAMERAVAQREASEDWRLTRESLVAVLQGRLYSSSTSR